MQFWKRKLFYFLKSIYMSETEMKKIIERVMGLVETTRQVIAYKQGRYNEQGFGGLGLSQDEILKASQGLSPEEFQFLQDNISFISDPEVVAFIQQEPLELGGGNVEVQAVVETSDSANRTVAMEVIRIPELSEEEKRFNIVRGKIDILLSKKNMGLVPSSEEELTEEEVQMFNTVSTKYRRDINDGKRIQFLKDRTETLKPREEQQQRLNESLRVLTDMMRPAAERRDPAQNLTPDGLLQVKRLALVLGVELSRDALTYIDAHTQAGSGDTQELELAKTSEKPPRRSLWDKIRGK